MSSPQSLPVRLGTRGSPLALAQTDELRRRLVAAHPGLAVEPVAIETTGDRVQDRPLKEIGGKGLFTKEIEESLLDGRIDMAVHSMKDVATRLPDGLAIVCLLPREDPRDVLVAAGARTLGGLAAGAVVGTSSLRRQALVLNLRPDLTVVPLRGNVGTRLRKLAEGQVHATLLALAGLRRLGRDGIGAALDPEELMPAVAQGAIGVETRAEDMVARALLEPLQDCATERAVAAERALLAALDGSCRTPIAALAEHQADGTLWLRALVAMPDGSAVWRAERRGSPAEAEAMGADAGSELRRRAGARLFTG